MGKKVSDVNIDDLLDDEGWSLLNELTEEELELLNADFDPESLLTPIIGRKFDSTQNGPMFKKEDLVENLERIVAESIPVIKNEKIRKKEEVKKQEKEEQLKRQYSRDRPDLVPQRSIALTEEEEDLLNNATEEELIEAAALLKMNGILTNEQISSVWAGEKPKGSSIRTSSSVKATEQKKCITAADEETELDVVELMRCCREDTDDLFYICINNQPNLERQIKLEVIKTVEQSLKVRHLSMAMTGLIDFEVKELATALRYNTRLETLNLESNIITMHGILVLMAEVGRHPSLREVKISNQKQPFGLQGEECMAAAIDKNENIIKFGYSFMQPGPRNKADRAIIRHNENLRQRRKNGEDVYDLKVVSKIRDEWPQPWIKVKGRRGLEKLIENKVMDMGHMDSSNTDKKGLKETSPAPVGAFNIKDLLAQRKATLQCANIEELEKEQERKRKQHFQEMEEYNKNNKSHDIVSKREDDKPYNNHSNGVENVIKRTTQAPKSVTQAPKSGETRGININELLTQRQAMLKSSKLEDLEREQERKRKEQFKEMEEFNKKGKIEDANNEVLKDNRVLQTKHAKIDEKNSKGSFSTNRTANGFSVNELLSQQKALIKGNKKIAELEKEQERKRKEQFKAMEEFDKSNQNSSSTDNSLQKTAPKNSDSESLVTVLSETKQKVVDDNHNSRSNPKNVHQKNETFVQDKSSKPDDNSETYVPPPHTTNELKKSSNNKIEKNDLKPSDNHSSNKNPAKKEVTIENEKLSEENKLRDAEKKRNLFSNSKKIGVEALQKTEISDTKKNEASDSKNENLKDAGKKEEESKKLVDEKKKVDESEKKQILDNKIATKDAASHSKSNVAEVKKGELDKLKEQRETRKKEEEEAKKAAEVKKGELDKLKEQREMRKKEEEEAKKVAEVKKGELDKLKEQRETRKKEEEEAKKAAEVKKGELDKLKEQRETRKKEEEEAKKAAEVKKGELDKLKEQREMRKKEEEEAKKLAEERKKEKEVENNIKLPLDTKNVGKKDIGSSSKGEKIELKKDQFIKQKEQSDGKKNFTEEKGRVDLIEKNPKLLFENKNSINKDSISRSKGDVAEPKKGDFDKLKEQSEARKKEEVAKKVLEEKKKAEEPESKTKLSSGSKYVDLKGTAEVTSSFKGNAAELKKGELDKSKEQREVLKKEEVKKVAEEKTKSKEDENKQKLLSVNKNVANADAASNLKGAANMQKGELDKTKEQREARIKEEETKKKAEEAEKKQRMLSESKNLSNKDPVSRSKGDAAELKNGEFDKLKEQRETTKKEQEAKKVAEEKGKEEDSKDKQKNLSDKKNLGTKDSFRSKEDFAEVKKGDFDNLKERREARKKEEEIKTFALDKKRAEESEKKNKPTENMNHGTNASKGESLESKKGDLVKLNDTNKKEEDKKFLNQVEANASKTQLPNKNSVKFEKKESPTLKEKMNHPEVKQVNQATSTATVEKKPVVENSINAETIQVSNASNNSKMDVVSDIFSDRSNDDGDGPRLSLRERMARRGK